MPGRRGVGRLAAQRGFERDRHGLLARPGELLALQLHGFELQRGRDALGGLEQLFASSETPEPALLDASESDANLIVAGTFAISETLGEVAKQYPDKKYILYDASLPYEEGGFENVYSILYKQNEGSYLGGVLAAGLLKSGKLPADVGSALGFLGGMDIPVINDFLVGYIAGAQSVTPDIKVAVSYAGSFTDAAKGKELGLAQYRAGVGIGFTAVVAGVLVWLAVRGNAASAQLGAVFLATQLALSVFSRADYLFTDVAATAVGNMPSDTAVIAQALGGTYWIWGLVCGLFSLAVLAAGVLWFLRAFRDPARPLHR